MYLICFSLISSVVFTEIQKSTIDERISSRQSEVELLYKNEVEKYQQAEVLARKRFEDCQKEHENDTVQNLFGDSCSMKLFVGRALPLNTMLKTDYTLNWLQENKLSLESYSDVFAVFILSILLLATIPAIRFVYLTIRWLKTKIRETISNTRSTIRQMTDFQRYSIILLMLIFIALIMIVALLSE